MERKTQIPVTNNGEPRQSAPQYGGRRTRIGLLALLVFAVLFAGGALFLKYRLEVLRAAVQQEVESRTGARFHVGEVLVNGLRGLRVENVEGTFEMPQGPTVRLNVPVGYIYIDLIDLIYGQVTIEQVQLDHSIVRVERPPDGLWLSPEGLRLTEASQFLEETSFRVVGHECTLEVLNVVDVSRLVLRNFDFDVSRLPDSPDIAAKLSGYLGDDAKFAKADVRFTSLEDFDARLECEAMTCEEVSIFLPTCHDILESGVTWPNVRIAGYPGATIIVGFDAPFQQVTVKNQPDFLDPASGVLNAVADYDLDTRELSLTTAKLESAQLSAEIDGAVSFAQDPPELDLRVEASELPWDDVINLAVQNRLDQYTDIDFSLEEPYEIAMRVQGTANTPVLTTNVSVAAGTLAFKPTNRSVPQGELALGKMVFTWDSENRTPQGSLALTGGTATDAFTGLKAERISGPLTIEKKTITVDPLNAEVNGNAFVGSMKLDVETGQMDFALSGTLTELEETLGRKLPPQLALAGAANIRCTGRRSARQYVLDAEIDATQSDIAYQWWFHKPEGVGALARDVHLELTPGKELTVTTHAEVASSQLSATALWKSQEGQWKLQSIEADSGTLDVVSVGKCLHIPYRVGGGAGTGVHYSWQRTGPAKDQWIMKADGLLDEIDLLPEGGEHPFALAELDFDVELANEPEATGRVSLTAGKARTPPFKATWFVPMTTPEIREKCPPKERAWTVAIASGETEVSPWSADRFEGEAFFNPVQAGLRTFRADVKGGGAIEGTFKRVQAENAYRFAGAWDSIPATYIIDHIGFPRVLSGTMSGGIDYSMDRDDPSTLQGEGQFAIREGKFSADFIFTKMLEANLEEGMSALPPSLAFDELSTDVILDGDRVITKNAKLASPSLTLTGDGSFVTGGDMDYDLKVSIAPEIGQRIDVLRDNFNIQGLQMAQQNIELAFKVQGPTFGPHSELSELPPLGITLVSSAFEVTSDAIRVIDIPRKILTDLLKIGAGVVGAAKPRD